MIVLLYAEKTVTLSISNAKNTVEVYKLARKVKLPGSVCARIITKNTSRTEVHLTNKFE